jgi:hypothetical protein
MRPAARRASCRTEASWLDLGSPRERPPCGWLASVGAESFRSFRYVDRTRIVIDNSNGADAQFASDLQAALSAAGFEVELREPSPRALYDTSVHFVVDGVAIRLQDDPRELDLAAIAKTVRETEARRPSGHRRFRDVPIYRGDSSRVLTWVDAFG